jgi:succinate-semialdehyde dehydrogenase/glutarate-semialdehyde dehydrogenase
MIALTAAPEPAVHTDQIPVLDPATGEELATIPAGSPEAADAAVRAARAAQPAWARTAPAERGAVLKAAARRLREHAEELAELQTREGGKPLADSRGGVEAGIGAIEQYAELGPLHRGRALAGAWEAADLMVHEPRGVVGLLVPWNDPLAIACGQIAACLVTGNAVVYKPSEKTPLSGRRLVELLHGDLPAGVLQLLLGDERAGRPLAQHEDVDLIVHTGSVQTGREVARACAGRLGKALLELGGKDALIVDAGVDAEWAAEQAASGAFANAGQVCTSVERIFVHAEVAEPFLAALARRAQALRVGPGLEPQTEMGPLIDAEQRTWVHAQVEDACHAGAELRCGGRLPEGPGFFYPPTVLVHPATATGLMEEETFGPVAAVRVVPSFDAALAEASSTHYGLAATVLTPSPLHAQRAWRELQVGTVKVNAVWGGAPGGAAEPRRRSGLGFGYGPELLDEVTAVKVVHLGVAPPASSAS